MKISRIKVPEELRRLSTHKIMEGTAIVRTKSLQPAAKKLLSISNIWASKKDRIGMTYQKKKKIECLL